ncbi:MAG: zinc ribbon domain-containing protein [Coprothermobacterota bacterium]|nr:zinc ribbon domain-containing protein [Coprothermobacterota bacterium]
MACIKCGAENPSGAVFCFQCGNSLKKPSRIPWGAWVGIIALVVIGISALLLWPHLVPPSPPRLIPDLADLVPPDCGFFLIQRNSSDANLAQTWTQAGVSELLQQATALLPLGGREQAVLIEGFLPQLRSHLQIAARWADDGQISWFGLTEVVDPDQFPTQMDLLASSLRQLGMEVFSLPLEEGSAWRWQGQSSLFLCLRSGMLFLASSEQNLRSLLQPSAPLRLRDNPDYRKYKTDYPASSIFLYVDFHRLPDFPPQLGTLVLAVPALEEEIQLKVECETDLNALLGGAGNPLTSLLVETMVNPDSFDSVPPEAVFAFSGPGFLGQLADFLIQQGSLEFPPFDFSWLDGETEIYLAPGKDLLTGLGVRFSLTPSQLQAGTKAIEGIEESAAMIELVTLSQKEVEGLTVTSLQLGDSRLLYTFSPDAFYLAFRPETMEMLLRTRSSGLSLAQQEDVRKVLPSLSAYSWKLYAQSNLLDILRPPTVEMPVAPNTGMGEGILLLGIKLLPDRVVMEGRFLPAAPAVTP